MSTWNPGGFEWIDKCIWFAFFELSGAITYPNKAINPIKMINIRLITPDRFFLILKKGFFKSLKLNRINYLSIYDTLKSLSTFKASST